MWISRRRSASILASAGMAAALTQAWQAAGTFVVQIGAAKILGAPGLGTIALCLGVIFMGAALTSGVVGDSLTVLDRHDRSIRAALEWWAVLLVATTSLTGAVALGASDVLSAGEALLLAAASIAFQVEEVLRRIHMARLDFWRLLPIDTVALAVSLAGLAVTAGTSSVTLGTFLGAVAAGQVAGCVTAVALLPAEERRLVRPRAGSRILVWRFGCWRGLQVSVNPLVLTVTRLVVIVAAGAASLGLLEAARILVAPLLLLAQGFGAFLFASYARQDDLPLEVVLRRATRVSTRLGLAVLAAGAVLSLATPVLDWLVTGPGLHVEAGSVLGWAAYGAAVAFLQPVAGLAAVRGRPGSVLATRAVASLASLGVVAVCLLTLSVPVVLAPLVLALGPLLGRALTLRLVLRPMAHRDRVLDGVPLAPPTAVAGQTHAPGARSPSERQEVRHGT